MLALDVWRRTFGYHPWHFWQWYNDKIPLDSKCNGLVFEYAWQNAQRTGRHELREAIANAESLLAQYLRFQVGLHYAEEEIALDLRGGWGCFTVQTCVGYLRGLGAEATQVLTSVPDDGQTVGYVDTDGDGLEETYRVSAITNAVALLPSTERYELHFRAADLGDDAYGTAPKQVDVVTPYAGPGDQVAFRGPAWVMARPILLEKVPPAGNTNDNGGLNPGTAFNKAPTVDVIRRYLDTTGTTADTGMAVLVWEKGCACDSTRQTQVVNASIIDAKAGLVRIDAYGATVCANRPPDKVILRYAAGAPDSACSGNWSKMVGRLAAAELTRELCACEAANGELYTWQFDRARSTGEDERYDISPTDLDNPLGTRWGAIYAWRQVMRHQHLRGMSL